MESWTDRHRRKVKQMGHISCAGGLKIRGTQILANSSITEYCTCTLKLVPEPVKRPEINHVAIVTTVMCF